MHLYSSTSDAEPGKAYRWRGVPVPCVCWYMYLQTSSQANIVSRPHTLPMSVWYNFHWHHLLRNRCMTPSVVVVQKTVPLCCDPYQMHRVCSCGLGAGDSVLVLIVDDIFFGKIPSILIQSSASNSSRAVHSSLCLPCLWEQPKFATDTELITTDLVQCTYPRMTRSSAAQESSRPSEFWMWLGTTDVALKIRSSYSELGELTQTCIFSLIRQFGVSQK